MISLGLHSGAAWFWLILVPVSGWLALKSRFLRPFIWNISGHDRYFLIVSTGIALVIAAFPFGYGFSALAKNAHSAWAVFWHFPLDGETVGASATIKLAFAWSAPIALVFGAASLGVSLLFGGEKLEDARRSFLAEKNGMLNFVTHAGHQYTLLMLTLSNRKIYIGWPRNLSDWDNPDPSKQYLYFSPWFSGFRTENTLELEITTDYSTLDDGFAKEDERYMMLLPVHEIVNVQPFDIDVYDKITEAASR